MTTSSRAPLPKPGLAAARRAWALGLGATLAVTACGDTKTTAKTDTSVGADTADTSEPPLTGVSLHVASADARSCELLVVDPDQVVGGVTFDPAVEGRFVDEGLRGAIAFFVKGDTAVQDGDVALAVAGGAAAASKLSLAKVTCFDKRGAPISGASVTLLR